MSDLPRSHELLSREESRLLIIDMQEKLVPAMHETEQLVDHCRRLISGAKVLGVPVTATEQYPKGLGGTIERLTEVLPVLGGGVRLNKKHEREDDETLDLAALVPSRPSKLEFSCLTCLNWGMAADDPDGRFKVVVAGIEAHVCVLQTVLDLLSYGFRVYVVADAVSSRKPYDKEIALQRLANSGAILTTTESVLFEWCERAGSPEFKAISQIVKG